MSLFMLTELRELRPLPFDEQGERKGSANSASGDVHVLSDGLEK